MVSYFKTQWLNVLLGVFDVGISIYHFCIEDPLWGVAWTVAAIVWFMTSFINYNDDRITLLEKKQERDDAMFELVQELLDANKIDRERATQLEARVKQLEGRR